MRLPPAAAAVSLSLLAVAGSSFGQKPDDQIAPASLAFQKRGETALAAGNASAAIDALETALVADPRNRGAYVVLGRATAAQGMPGKAIGYYKDALQLEPNDLAALSGEGDALVQRGAIDRAKANLAKIQTICKTGCAPATTLAAAIAKGPPPVVQTAQASDKVPPKGQEQSAAPAKN